MRIEEDGEEASSVEGVRGRNRCQDRYDGFTPSFLAQASNARLKVDPPALTAWEA
jgi:hypothetical protein